MLPTGPCSPGKHFLSYLLGTFLLVNVDDAPIRRPFQGSLCVFVSVHKLFLQRDLFNTYSCHYTLMCFFNGLESNVDSCNLGRFCSEMELFLAAKSTVSRIRLIRVRYNRAIVYAHIPVCMKSRHNCEHFFFSYVHVCMLWSVGQHNSFDGP